MGRNLEKITGKKFDQLSVALPELLRAEVRMGRGKKESPGEAV